MYLSPDIHYLHTAYLSAKIHDFFWIYLSLQLQAKGFLRMDALEPSEGMLNLAKAKGIYERTFLSYLDGEPLQIESSKYSIPFIAHITNINIYMDYIYYRLLDETSVEDHWARVMVTIS